MGKAGGGGRHTAYQPQRVPPVAGVVDAVGGDDHLLTGPPGGRLPAQLVGEGGLPAETLRAELGAVQRVQPQPGGTGPGRVGGGGTDKLGEVQDGAQARQAGLGIGPPGQYPVTVGRVSRQWPCRVAVGQDAVLPRVGVDVRIGPPDGDVRDGIIGAGRSPTAAVERVGLVVVGPGRGGLPAQTHLPLGGLGQQPHRGGRLGDVQAGEAGGGVGVVELHAVAVGIGFRIKASINVDRVHCSGGQAGVDGGYGGPVTARQGGGPLQAVLVGTPQVPRLQADGPAPAHGDAAPLGIGGVDRHLGHDRGQQGQGQTGLLGDYAHTPVETAAAVGVLGHQAVGVAHPPLQGGGVGVGRHPGRHAAHLAVAQPSGQPGGAGRGGVGGAAFPAVDDEHRRVAPGAGGAGVGTPVELDGPPAHTGGGAGGEVLHRGPDQADAQGLEGDQGHDAAGGHIGDLEGHIVGGQPELLAAGLPGEGGLGRLGQGAGRSAPPAQAGKGGGDQFTGGQGQPIGSYVEDPPEGRDDEPVAIGVSGRDGLADERTGGDAQVGQGLDQGALVGLVEHDDLHVAGDLADEHPVAPLLDDEGEVVLALLTGGIPAELARAGIDGEGGCAAGLAGGGESGGVEVGGDVAAFASGLAGDVLGDAQPEGEAVAIGVEGGRVVAEALADAG
ncbi:MAG TPA: hypothetical protein VK404_01750 [Spirosoma sp.]|nr:hypothetical protein [Spirosoma sp.]